MPDRNVSWHLVWCVINLHCHVGKFFITLLGSFRGISQSTIYVFSITPLPHSAESDMIGILFDNVEFMRVSFTKSK